MPVPENTEEGSEVKDVLPSTNNEEKTLTITTSAEDQTSDVVETEDAMPAKKKKKKLRMRRRQLVTRSADRSTEVEPEVVTDNILEDAKTSNGDGETCAKASNGETCVKTSNGDGETSVKTSNGDGETCAKTSNGDGEKTGVPNESENAADVSEQAIKETTTQLVRPPKPPPSLAYDEVTRFSRTMHYADFRKCFKAKKFLTSKIKSQYKTLLPTNGDFVWFRAQNDSANTDAQDWFGNVRCSFDLLNFLNENKSINLFYVDCAYFGFSSASRILLTKKTQFGNGKKISLDSLRFGDPLMFDGEKLFFLRKDVSRNKKWYGSHQTELVIDAGSIDTGNLFEICDKTPVNHSNANRKGKNGRFVYHQCLIYNSTKKKCPSAWTAEATAKCLKDFMGIENSSSVPKI